MGPDSCSKEFAVADVAAGTVVVSVGGGIAVDPTAASGDYQFALCLRIVDGTGNVVAEDSSAKTLVPGEVDDDFGIRMQFKGCYEAGAEFSVEAVLLSFAPNGKVKLHQTAECTFKIK